MPCNSPHITEFERMATQLAVEFINMPAENIDEQITNALKCVVEFLDFDRASLSQYFDEKEKIVTHCWGKEGVPQASGYSATEKFPYLTRTLKQEKIREAFLIKIDTLPEKANIDKETMAVYGPKVMAIIPLYCSNKLIGALTAGSFSEHPDVPQTKLNCLPLLGTILVNALQKRNMELHLKQALEEVTRLKNLMKAENCILDADLGRRCSPPENMIGTSPAFRQLLQQIEQVATTDATVLILGETGTGKELVARSIHGLSKRSGRAMICTNCAAFSPELIESELFGHEKGAFTGALNRKLGRFEIADGSSLFFDEIGELSLAAQTKLLRVLQEKQFERIGSAKPIHIDVRILAATNRDLRAEMEHGRFREDLFFRLNVFPIHVPPLRERLEDIPLMVQKFIADFSLALGKDVRQVDGNDIHLLQDYSWPGNVRELRNVVERAMILSTTSTLRIPLPERSDSDVAVGSLKDMERRNILAALEKTAWRVSGQQGAAKILQINPKTLESRMRRLGIMRPANKTE